MTAIEVQGAEIYQRWNQCTHHLANSVAGIPIVCCLSLELIQAYSPKLSVLPGDLQGHYPKIVRSLGICNDSVDQCQLDMISEVSTVIRTGGKPQKSQPNLATRPCGTCPTNLQHKFETSHCGTCLSNPRMKAGPGESKEALSPPHQYRATRQTYRLFITTTYLKVK